MKLSGLSILMGLVLGLGILGIALVLEQGVQILEHGENNSSK